MSIKITYFVHGTTIDNQNGISSGWYDIELSNMGIQQSLTLRNQLKDKSFDLIFSSDLKRAKESARLAFEDTAPILYDQRLRECNYGDYNAKPSSIVEPMQEDNIMKRFPNGESYEDVKVRIEDFLIFLKNNYDGKNIGIVAHKAPQFALDVLLKGQTRKETFENDRRKKKAWQPGREYILE